MIYVSVTYFLKPITYYPLPIAPQRHQQLVFGGNGIYAKVGTMRSTFASLRVMGNELAG